MPDYRVHLLSPAMMRDQEIGRLQSDLREVLEFIKYSQNYELLREIIHSNTRFEQVAPDAVRVINIMMGSKIEIGGKGETVNMCKALEDMVEQDVQRGIKQGIKQGREEGKLQGGIEALILDNQEDGTPTERIIEKLQKRFSLPPEQAKQYIKKFSET